MAEHLKPLSDEQRARIQRAADREMAGRVRPGGPFYPVVAMVVCVASEYGTDYPVVAWSTVVFLTALAALRMAAVERLARGVSGGLTAVRASSLAIGAVWAIFTAFGILMYGLTFPGVLVIVCTMGMSAGGHIAFVVDRPLHTAYILVLGGTVGIALATSGVQGAAAMVVLTLIYITFMLQQGKAGHTAFWVGLENVERLRQAHAAAEAASTAKSGFLANMSHELRTPISGIMGVTDMMLDEAQSETSHDRLLLVNSSAAGLLSVVDDILSLSKIEAGHVSVQVEAFSLRKTLAETVRLLSWPVRRHTPPRIDVLAEVDHDVPDALHGDRGKLRQILTNLVGNAFKFTDDGLVGVFVSRDRVEDGRVWLRFAVRDTGVGIPDDKQRAIFDSFTQVDGSSSRRFGGTGLGLTISSSLVTTLDGSLTVESAPGEGSVFTLTLPFPFSLAAGCHPMPPAEAVEALDGRTVAVVDPSARVRDSLSTMMTPWGLRVRYAERLDELTDTARDVVVVDEHVLATGTAPGGPLIVLTTPPGRRSTGSVRATLPKPVEPGELLEALLHVWDIAVAPPEQAPPTMTLPPAPRPMSMPTGVRVLLVEDNAVNRTVAVHVFRKLGCVVTAVDGGAAALEALRSGQPFDVVFMDVSMPDMDGFEVTRRIRDGEAGDPKVAIVALTAHAMEGDEARCRQAGMDGYLAKPLNQERALQSITELRDYSSSST